MRKVMTAAALVLALAPGARISAAPQIYKVGQDGVKAPVVTRDVKPVYTKDAMDRKVQGHVELEAVVQKDGTVGDVRVTQSLDADLDAQAITAAKQWQFRPGTKDGKAVDVEVAIEMTFTLK
jgi:TonB family protein